MHTYIHHTHTQFYMYFKCKRWLKFTYQVTESRVNETMYLVIIHSVMTVDKGLEQVVRFTFEMGNLILRDKEKEGSGSIGDKIKDRDI